jgi:type II secretory pathway predicted ATPase ExeA
MNTEKGSMQLVLTELGISQRDLARGAGLARSVAGRLVTHGELPKRDGDAVRRRVVAFLQKQGATALQLRDLILAATPKKKAPESRELAGAAPEATSTNETTGVITMLLRNEPLTLQAKKHFGLSRSPFLDDVASRDDVFASPSTRYVRATLMDAAKHHGFVALIGESGSGKSTLREDLEERIRDEKLPIVVIRPHVIGVEPTEQKGKVLKAGHIAEAIAATIAPSVQLKSSPEARYRQIHQLLKDSCAAGFSHLVVIEEAHRLPIATLKHLKNFMELKDGLRRLMGVCLIGQPELQVLLSEQRAEIREIVQRCEQVRLEPLDNDLCAYLRHKFARMGLKYEDMFTDDACDAVRARLVHIPRGGKSSDAYSVCYPLVVNNLVARAMNAAAEAGFEKVDAQVIAGC